jgi:hypothetical protein
MLYPVAKNLSLSFGNWIRAGSISYRIFLLPFAAWLSRRMDDYMPLSSLTIP